MEKCSSRWCLWGTVFLSLLFLAISGLLYLVKRDEHVKAVFCLLIFSFFIWLLLVLCGCIIDDKLNPFQSWLSFILWSSSLLFVLFLIIYSFLLLARYEKHNRLSIDLDGSSLNRFNLTSTSPSLLNYSVAFQVSVTHHRKDTGVYFESFQIRARYQNHRFASISLPAFYVAETANKSFNSSTVLLYPILEGNYSLGLTDAQLIRYEQDAAGRIFGIDFIVEYVGFRCSFNEYKAISILNKSNETPLKHKLKDSRDYIYRGMSLPNATGSWAAEDAGDIICFVFGIIIFLLGSLIVCLISSTMEEVDHSSTKEQEIGAPICMISIGLFIIFLARETGKTTTDRLSFEAYETMISEFTIFPDNGTLTYNLSLSISIGPNKKKTGIYYTELEVVAMYHGYKFTSSALFSPSYLQGKRKKGGIMLWFFPSFVGNLTTVFTGEVLKHYRNNKKSGCYTIDFLLYYKGFQTNKVKDFQRGKMVQGVAKCKRKFPEKCNEKESDNTYW